MRHTHVTMQALLLGIVSISIRLLFFTYCFIKVAFKAVLFYLLLIQVKFFVQSECTVLLSLCAMCVTYDDVLGQVIITLTTTKPVTTKFLIKLFNKQFSCVFIFQLCFPTLVKRSLLFLVLNWSDPSHHPKQRTYIYRVQNNRIKDRFLIG